MIFRLMIKLMSEQIYKDIPSKTSNNTVNYAADFYDVSTWIEVRKF